MKISLDWLKDYVAIPLAADKLAHRLTLAGLEVEKIETANGDTSMEMEITPNRPDCLNMLGVAREISAVLNKPLKAPKVKKISVPKDRCNIEISDREGCGRYVGIIVRGVKVGSSPEWLQKRLLSVGLRPINNIVDITNFVLMETGQPSHAFDHGRLNEGKIVVRRARAGEKLKTLDGIERTLDPSILVISDAKTAVALAGIMGGEGSEVTATTTNILLESAYFNPIVIRRDGRRLGISTDSSYRFERGVDIENVERAAMRAIALILEIAGGKVCAKSDLRISKAKPAKPIAVSLAAVERQLGATVTAVRAKTILKKLGFCVRPKGKGALSITPPSFRPDVKRVEDIVEELARVIGYDRLPSSLPTVVVSDIPGDPRRQIKEKIRQLLTGLGFSEINTYTLINQPMLDKTSLGQVKGVHIQNPLTQEQQMLRPAILPSFLAVTLLNLNRGQRDLQFFEIAKVYSPTGAETEKIALLLAGQGTRDWRATQKKMAGLYDLKGAAEQMLAKLGVSNLQTQATGSKIFSQDEVAALTSGSTEVAIVGKVNKEILRNWDIKHTDVFYAEIDLEYAYKQKVAIKEFREIPNYPAISRDISLAVKAETTFTQIRELVRSVAGEFLSEIRFQELYLGEKIPAGHRGYVISLIYQSTTRTLTEEEVSQVHERVVRVLVEKTGAVIR